MTMLIGLNGNAGAGKDTVADILVSRFGWRKFSFSDHLYREIADAFRVDVDLLQDRRTKELPLTCLRLSMCSDDVFVGTMSRQAIASGEYDALTFLSAPRSPRWMLQQWGTTYRRAQDPEYWIKRSQADYFDMVRAGVPGAVNTSVRFDNEARWVDGQMGTIVYVNRVGVYPQSDFLSERPLDPNKIDYWLNNPEGDMPRLCSAVRELEASVRERCGA